MKPDLFYVGIAHDHAPLSVRERLHPFADAQEAVLAQISPLAPERLVLSTCERFELYAYTHRLHVDAWANRLAAWFSVSDSDLSRYIRTLRADAVAHHLLRVAAGLESRIVGENQILGQVRAAYLTALRASALGPMLSALGRSAIHTGKRVRNETIINAGVRSLGSIAVRHVEQALGVLKDVRVLIVGTGRLASEVAGAFAARGIHELSICGRKLDRAEALAQRFSGRATRLTQLAAEMSKVSAIITCTSAPDFIINSALAAQINGRHVEMLDLSVPRNIDPSVARIPGVRLTHLDELPLGQTSKQHVLASAEHIVENECRRFARWMRERELAPTISTMVRLARESSMSNPSEQKRALHARIVRLKAGVAA